jgi:hypothetical protein
MRMHCTSRNWQPTVTLSHVRSGPIRLTFGTAFVTASVADSVQPYAGSTTPSLSHNPCPSPGEGAHTWQHSDACTLCNWLAYMGTHSQTLTALQPACSAVVEAADHLTRRAFNVVQRERYHSINQSVAAGDTVACLQHTTVAAQAAAAQATAAAAQAALTTKNTGSCSTLCHRDAAQQ